MREYIFLSVCCTAEVLMKDGPQIQARGRSQFTNKSRGFYSRIYSSSTFTLQSITT